MRTADSRVLLISPVHNEAQHLGAVIEGVLAQTRPPDLWLIVNDDSVDETAEIAAQATQQAPFIRLVSTPAGYTGASGDRNAAGGPDRAFNFGLEEVEWTSYTHVGKLDGDIVLPPDYLAGILSRFEQEPALGIAGGAILELRKNNWRRIPTPLDHPTAPARIYSTDCFRAIGGMPPYMGADVITTMYAKLRGFTTRTFPELGVRHLRPLATADGVRRGRMRQGAYQYLVHYHPLWIVARSLLVGARFKPYGLSGWWFLRGYLQAALGPKRPVSDPELRAFIRAEQRERVTRVLRRLARR